MTHYAQFRQPFSKMTYSDLQKPISKFVKQPGVLGRVAVEMIKILRPKADAKGLTNNLDKVTNSKWVMERGYEQHSQFILQDCIVVKSNLLPFL